MASNLILYRSRGEQSNSGAAIHGGEDGGYIRPTVGARAGKRVR